MHLKFCPKGEMQSVVTSSYGMECIEEKGADGAEEEEEEEKEEEVHFCAIVAVHIFPCNVHPGLQEESRRSNKNDRLILLNQLIPLTFSILFSFLGQGEEDHQNRVTEEFNNCDDWFKAHVYLSQDGGGGGEGRCSSGGAQLDGFFSAHIHPSKCSSHESQNFLTAKEAVAALPSSAKFRHATWCQGATAAMLRTNASCCPAVDLTSPSGIGSSNHVGARSGLASKSITSPMQCCAREAERCNRHGQHGEREGTPWAWRGRGGSESRWGSFDGMACVLGDTDFGAGFCDSGLSVPPSTPAALLVSANITMCTASYAWCTMMQKMYEHCSAADDDDNGSASSCSAGGAVTGKWSDPLVAEEHGQVLFRMATRLNFEPVTSGVTDQHSDSKSGRGHVSSNLLLEGTVPGFEPVTCGRLLVATCERRDCSSNAEQQNCCCTVVSRTRANIQVASPRYRERVLFELSDPFARFRAHRSQFPLFAFTIPDSANCSSAWITTSQGVLYRLRATQVIIVLLGFIFLMAFLTSLANECQQQRRDSQPYRVELPDLGCTWRMVNWIVQLTDDEGEPYSYLHYLAENHDLFGLCYGDFHRVSRPLRLAMLFTTLAFFYSLATLYASMDHIQRVCKPITNLKVSDLSRPLFGSSRFYYSYKSIAIVLSLKIIFGAGMRRWARASQAGSYRFKQLFRWSCVLIYLGLMTGTVVFQAMLSKDLSWAVRWQAYLIVFLCTQLFTWFLWDNLLTSVFWVIGRWQFDQALAKYQRNLDEQTNASTRLRSQSDAPRRSAWSNFRDRALSRMARSNPIYV
ncbi:hypothetical protein CBR_g41238 [Chara braunii]|uniref:Uncharacterized protein n=1 Tax=Chara braunii TaxID=69332 RepID=A0A388LVF9_CHABU|nr:hypothetical protein CBR_g41238 [Chara braunii]|eukprot:GBG86245.1 hypothetical protein CBR_g41238 [Chara braunii]